MLITPTNNLSFFNYILYSLVFITFSVECDRNLSESTRFYKRSRKSSGVTSYFFLPEGNYFFQIAETAFQKFNKSSQEQRQYEIVFVKGINSFRRTNHQTNTSFILKAFKKTFVLQVEPCVHLLSSSFHILTYKSQFANSSIEVKSGKHLRDCVFKGYVKNDATSLVSLNVCKGLSGFIHTCDADYEIQPYNKTLSSAHIVYKIKEYSNSSCHFIENNTSSYSKMHHKSRRSVSNQWNVETMVVADSKMLKYHGDNLEMYILTLMSSVALIFKDPTIGNNVNITIVKLIIMSEEEDKGIIYPSASKTLRNFCRWQKEELHGVHGHDTAILLTREDLCRHSNTCDTLGLAQSGMICDPGNSCAVVEDNGLGAAFTVVHEIGHILGIPHDDDEKCNRFHQQGQRLYVMARMLDYNSYPHSWSECSKHYLTTFLDSGYGHCLLSRTNEDLLTHFEHTNTLPGELYDMDYQCELVYGKGSRICPYMPVCKRLWCTMEDITQGGCRTQHMPWADGTRCGLDKSCYHGECVNDPVSALPQNGQWGEWQKYGSCSRSCGGGIARSIRYCDNPKPSHGGQYCVGDRVRYKSCQTQRVTPNFDAIIEFPGPNQPGKDCPPGTKDFRAEQCSAFNGKTFGFAGIKENVRWVPHFSETEIKDRCKLYCRAAGTAAYYLLKEKVIDGTTCGPDTFDLCINGKCMAAGCDHKLNSVKVLDSCGVCGGNGSSCTVMRGTYAPKTIKYGYNTVLKIPAGASNIYVLQHGIENGTDDNYLALKAPDGSYILNGNFMVSMFPKSVEYAGSLFDYTGSSVAIERINASKRLQKDIEIEVLTVGSLLPPEISYEFTSSKYSVVDYRWRLEKTWSPCNSICEGEQYRKTVCVDEMDGQIMNDELCQEQERPAHEARSCNPSCTLRWNVKTDNVCSTSCGPGILRKTVECSQYLKSGETLTMHNNFCAHIEPKPSDTEECMGLCKTKEWVYGEWSKCSASCGSGVQRRTARCVGDGSVELDDFACNNITKNTVQFCTTSDCPSWKTGEWSECSVTCGNGWKNRKVSCMFENREVSFKKCQDSDRPQDHSSCFNGVCNDESDNGLFVSLLPPPTSIQITSVWVVTNWSMCSVTCGSGIQKREVTCMSSLYNRSNDDTCDPRLKPRSVKFCRPGKCPPVAAEENPVKSNAEIEGYWRTGLWGKCSKSCGGGVRRRQVACYDNKGLITDKCELALRPSDTSICNEDRCPGWRMSPWSQCSVTCGKGVQTRSVRCFSSRGMQLPPERCFLPAPKDEKRCKRSPCLSWAWSEWSPCSASCTGGTQTRTAVCRRGSRTVEDKFCKEYPKPNPEVKYCNRQRCKIHWRKKSWSKCSVTCGKGYKFRNITCVSGRNIEVEDRLCSHLRKPKTRRKCHRFKCSMTWIAGEWSQCSKSCGNGVQTRSVTCHRVNAYHWVDPRPVSEDEQMACRPSEKPTATKSCNLGNCSDNIWRVGPWLPCSVTCGGGKQRRKVRCYGTDGRRVPNTECDENAKPQRRRHCFSRPCAAINCYDFKTRGNISEDGEQDIYLRGRYVKIFCSKMNTSQPKEYVTLPRGEQDNYSEVYSKRLKNASTCPYRGARFDACDCESDENINAGLTSFQRIGINITTLAVNTHDLTFSQTHKGSPVPFGESGDCYSKVSCPQGRFSLSLLGTGFVVSPLTKWVTVGNYSSSRIRWLEGGQVIQGKCGGYCARCSASGHTGLILDVAPP